MFGNLISLGPQCNKVGDSFFKQLRATRDYSNNPVHTDFLQAANKHKDYVAQELRSSTTDDIDTMWCNMRKVFGLGRSKKT